MFKPGDWVWTIEEDDDGQDSVVGVLFMAECMDYVICVSEYYGCDFDEQLEEMAEDSDMGDEVNVYVLRKHLCFKTRDEAEKHLENMK